MLCIAFIVCLVLLLRRRRTGTTNAVPLAVIGLGTIRAVLMAITIVHLIGTFRHIANLAPEDKSTVLAAGIAEAMQYATFGMIFEIPLLIVAWVVDSRLRQRQRPKLTPAQQAPPGTRCAVHADMAASSICSRCGAFMCSECIAQDGALCSRCSARAQSA